MDDERVDEIFERIGEMDLELDYDPIERGPKFLNNMVAKCRNFTNEVQRFARECQMYMRTIERRLRMVEADFELQYNDLMANDPEIVQMRGLSKADREALARTKLQEEIGRINDLQLSLTDAGHVDTVIESKLRELRDVNRDIRLQKQLIQAEIETGAMWGNDMGDFDSPQIEAEDIEVDSEDMFENPDEDPETKGKSEPDYENLFVIGDDQEKSDQGLDSADQDAMVESSDTDQSVSDKPDVGEADKTAVFEEESEMDLDFEAALESLA